MIFLLGNGKDMSDLSMKKSTFEKDRGIKISLTWMKKNSLPYYLDYKGTLMPKKHN
jgi:hypothetical protein